MESSSSYDVVIVGGRPAGATLAARLGARGARVLVVDRAKFPSLPAVPSSPVLYPSGMLLLDELGIDEASYADPHSRMESFCFEFDPWWSTVMRVPPSHGRNYVLGLDRSRFDSALWENLARLPSVERREEFSVRDVLRDGSGRVAGIVGASSGAAEERIQARCVIGADGRFSSVARRVSAPVVEELNAHASTVYYADWEGVGPRGDGLPGGGLCTRGRGLDVLFIAMPGGRVSVNTHARADRTHVRGDAQSYYLETLNSLPSAARRLSGARQVSRVVGVKRIANGFRQASGPGWALVGDALHYKDPVDGQGIHDALLEARLLDAALADFLSGARSWDEAMSGYAEAVRAATRPMFLATTTRLRRELYAEPPVPVIRTLLRWMMTDPAYQTQFLRYLNRDVAPDGWMTGELIAGAVLRGIGRDMGALWRSAFPASGAP